MLVTTLVENRRLVDREDLHPEHGLSLHVQLEGASVLFDTGMTDAFALNAEALGVDLAVVDAVVLSHQHYDHGGGLARFFELDSQAKVYLRDAPRVERVAKALLVVRKPIGLDLELLERHADRLRWIEGPHELLPGVFLLTAIRSEHPRPRGNSRLHARTESGLVPDPFDHELVMVVREAEGMVVFTGCSHNGILNLIDTARAAFPGVPIRAVIGGFHLIGLPVGDTMAASPDEVRSLGRQVLEPVEGRVFSGHCTGRKAFAILEEVMGERLQPFHTGSRLEL